MDHTHPSESSGPTISSSTRVVVPLLPTRLPVTVSAAVETATPSVVRTFQLGKSARGITFRELPEGGH